MLVSRFQFQFDLHHNYSPLAASRLGSSTIQQHLLNIRLCGCKGRLRVCPLRLHSIGPLLRCCGLSANSLKCTLGNRCCRSAHLSACHGSSLDRLVCGNCQPAAMVRDENHDLYRVDHRAANGSWRSRLSRCNHVRSQRAASRSRLNCECTSWWQYTAGCELYSIITARRAPEMATRSCCSTAAPRCLPRGHQLLHRTHARSSSKRRR